MTTLFPPTRTKTMIPKLIVRAGSAKGLVHEIVTPVVAIGRQEFNSPDMFTVKDKMVSRKHCQITCDGDTYRLHDLGSRNGTFINGSPVKEAELRHKDEIRIGETWLLFLLHEEAEADLDPARVHILDDDLLTQSTVLLRSEDSFYLNGSKTPHRPELAARVEQNYQTLLQLGREINTIRSSEELQQRLLELVFMVIPAERGAILMTAPGEGEFTSRVVRYRQQQMEGQELIISRTILRQAKDANGGILTLSQDLEASPDPQKSLLTSGAKSVLAARLATATEIFGIIYLDTTNPNVQFDQEHLQLLTAIANLAAGALETARYVDGLSSDKKRLQEELDANHKMIGDSEPLRLVRERIVKIAPTDVSVLIRGESGTGKELVARAIHQNSERKDKPFVAINCATLPDHLVESELFGYEKGAFTGAVSRKLGKFELADGGTIFLDEIGELKPELQAKLLRVLQESEIERLGGTQSVKVNVRLVAATNKDLEAAIQTGGFREDLFFRLDVLTIKIPSLRERADDIQQLANYFTSKYAIKCKRRIKGISQPARECLQRYGWQGNVRELENAIEHAVVLAATDLILPEDLPEKVLACEPAPDEGSQTVNSNQNIITQPDIPVSVTNFHKAVNEAKKKIILDALEQAGGHRTEAARLLGVHPNNLDRLIRQHNLRSGQKKQES